MIEEYLNECTYNYKVYSKVTKNNATYALVTEFTPTGEESDVYLLI